MTDIFPKDFRSYTGMNSNDLNALPAEEFMEKVYGFTIAKLDYLQDLAVVFRGEADGSKKPDYERLIDSLEMTKSNLRLQK